MKKYLKTYCVALILCFAFASFPMFYLYKIGEYTKLDTIVEQQQEKLPDKLLYGTGVNNNTFAYKVELLKHRQPKIAALGSSRVMQFRQTMFSEPFVNLGGTMGNIKSGLHILPEIIEAHPNLVILGIDIWWFNKNHTLPHIPFKPPAKTFNPVLSLNHSVLFLEWLKKGKLRFADIQQALGQPIHDYGVSGQKKDGYGPDGSYYYTRTVTGLEETDDAHFEDSFFRINDGTQRFEYASHIHRPHLDEFLELVQTLEEENIKTIIFFPPLAPDVYEHFMKKQENYKYVPELKSLLRDNDVKFFDFTNPADLQTNNCEFIDGFHGGEITYMRILRELARNDNALKQSLKNDILDESIEKYKGKTFIPDPYITTDPEINFLKLPECKKS